MTVLKDLKQELKTLAKLVTSTKAEYKQLQKEKKTYYPKMSEHHHLRIEYRHKHIAYCLVRGKAYEQIEQPKEENRPNMAVVFRYVAAIYEKMVAQCDSERLLVYSLLLDEAVAKAEELRKTGQPSVYINAPESRLQQHGKKPVTAAAVAKSIQTFKPEVSLAEIVRTRSQGSEQAATSRSGWSWLSSVFNRTRN